MSNAKESNISPTDRPTIGDPLLTFDNVTLGYGRRIVLADVSFELCAGDYVGVVGPNGAGKTTLLHAILGLLEPKAGSIRTSRPLTFGYVPQAQTMNVLFPLTALEVVLMGRYRALGALRRPGKIEREAALAVLEQVGVAELSTRLFRELSGGQKQRVLIARALVAQPDALVLDEPTSALDVAAEHSTMEVVDRLHAERGLLVLMVSHALNVVANHVRQVAILGGARFEMGPVDTIVRPDKLLSLYGLPLEVAELGGRRIVL